MKIKKFKKDINLKFSLPDNNYFFATPSELIYRCIKELKKLYKEDNFGYFLILSELNNKKLKFIKKTYFPHFLRLDSNKNYVIFINYEKKTHIELNNKLISKTTNNVILFLENKIDNGICIYEICP